MGSDQQEPCGDDPSAPELLAALQACARDIARSERRPALQPHQEQAVLAAAEAGWGMRVQAHRPALPKETLKPAEGWLVQFGQACGGPTPSCRSRSRQCRRGLPSAGRSSAVALWAWMSAEFRVLYLHQMLSRRATARPCGLQRSFSSGQLRWLCLLCHLVFNLPCRGHAMAMLRPCHVHTSGLQEPGGCFEIGGGTPKP